MRLRDNLSLSEAEYKQVEALPKAGRYASPCACVRALLIQVNLYAERQTQGRARQRPAPIEEEINAIFANLMDWDAEEAAKIRAAIWANEKK